MDEVEQVDAPAAEPATPATVEPSYSDIGMLGLQRTAGNAAIARLIGGRASDVSRLPAQAAVMLGLQRTAGNAAVTRMLARRPTAKLAVSRTGMPADTQALLEARLGHDFSHVRVRADGEALRRTSALGARAMTEGSTVYVHPAHYQPDTRDGLGLLAHELTHVVQQQRGQFPAVASDRPAQVRLALEREAERAERAVHNPKTQLSIIGRARPGVVQASLLEEMKAIASGGIEALADWVLSHAEAMANPLIAELAELRGRLKGLTELRVAPQAAARLEAIYEELRDLLPSWVPVPTLRFDGGPTQQDGGVISIPILMLILLIIMAILILWYSADPKTGKARGQKAVEDLIKEIEEGMKPKEEPPPDPKPDPRPPPPIGPDPVPPKPDEDEKPKIEKVADSNIFMDRIEGGVAQRARIDTGYLANSKLTLYVPAAAVGEVLAVDPAGTQAARLAGAPGGATVVRDSDGNLDPYRAGLPDIVSAKFNENDLKIAVRAKERSLPLLSANSRLQAQLVDGNFPKRVAAVGTVMVEVP